MKRTFKEMAKKATPQSLFGVPYTQEELNVAFKKVQDKEHWKNPIHAVVDASENLHLIKEAIRWFTATEAVFDILDVQQDGTKVLVRADGYFRGPAGDH